MNDIMELKSAYIYDGVIKAMANTSDYSFLCGNAYATAEGGLIEQKHGKYYIDFDYVDDKLVEKLLNQ